MFRSRGPNQQFANQEFANQEFPNPQFLNQKFLNQKFLDQEFPNPEFLNPRFSFVIRTACLLLVVLLPFSTFAQKNSSANGWPKYDLKAETKIKGTIQQLRPFASGNHNILELVLQGKTQTSSVFLCPKSYLAAMGMELKPGDEVEVTGSKVQQNGSDVVLARELVKGNDTLVMRDDKGIPVWNWKHS